MNRISVRNTRKFVLKFTVCESKLDFGHHALFQCRTPFVEDLMNVESA
jgi:hypothetical protein